MWDSKTKILMLLMYTSKIFKDIHIQKQTKQLKPVDCITKHAPFHAQQKQVNSSRPGLPPGGERTPVGGLMRLMARARDILVSPRFLPERSKSMVGEKLTEIDLIY